jgi:hypothetical protein
VGRPNFELDALLRRRFFGVVVGAMWLETWTRRSLAVSNDVASLRDE